MSILTDRQKLEIAMKALRHADEVLYDLVYCKSAEVSGAVAKICRNASYETTQAIDTIFYSEREEREQAEDAEDTALFNFLHRREK